MRVLLLLVLVGRWWGWLLVWLLMLGLLLLGLLLLLLLVVRRLVLVR